MYSDTGVMYSLYMVTNVSNTRVIYNLYMVTNVSNTGVIYNLYLVTSVSNTGTVLFETSINQSLEMPYIHAMHASYI